MKQHVGGNSGLWPEPATAISGGKKHDREPNSRRSAESLAGEESNGTCGAGAIPTSAATHDCRCGSAHHRHWFTGYVEKWLWMRQVDYIGIFWTLLSVQWTMFLPAFFFAFLYLWINLRQAAKDSASFRGGGQVWRPVLFRMPMLKRRQVSISLPPF